MLFRWEALERAHLGEAEEDGLAVFRGEGPWGVSTLKINPLTNEPYVSLFEDKGDAIAYARLRALRTGSARRSGRGRVYFVLYYPHGGHDERGCAEASVHYRVLRGQRGARRTAGGYASERQEQVMVFKTKGLDSAGHIRWKLDKKYTVDVRDIEAEYEEARQARGTRKMTREERRGDPSGETLLYTEEL